MSKTFQVGDTFTHIRVCSRYTPIYYAAASGDFNPIHIDHEAGKNAGLGGNILQGLCTLSWAVEAFTKFVEDPGAIKSVKVRFSKPVSVDDTVTFEGVVTKVEAGLVASEIHAKNQKGEIVMKNAILEARVDHAG